MKCYYEELGISREAEDTEIKSAYRKLALRWHPDKNPDCLEEAKERFQTIQQAYEVLSDPQERDFYDRHREQILRGKNSNYEDNTLDVYPYFTSACYKGFGDDEKGFYAVYQEVFNKIASEDAEFMDDDDELEEIPSFGNSQSSYEDVATFYAYWQSYCTKKSYAWLCPYDIQEIKDRRILRAVQKETKKIVQNAKKERNDEIRSLVAFVRKRDKRMQAYNRLLEERAAVNREKGEKNRQAQLLKRHRELEEMQSKRHVVNDDYEEQLKQLEQEYGNDSDEYVIENDENEHAEEQQKTEEYYEEEFFCVACSKAFKNEKNFENHTFSKKHKENEERLRLEMLEEEESFGKLSIDECKDAKVKDSNDEDEVEAASVEYEKLKNTKRKKPKKTLSKAVKASEDEESETENFLLKNNVEVNDSDEDWCEHAIKKGNRKQQKKKPNKKTDNEFTKNELEKPIEPVPAIATKKIAVETSCYSESQNIHLCATCQATFESKNKLFAHLKKTNHSVYLPKRNFENPTNSTNAATKKEKGKKRK